VRKLTAYNFITLDGYFKGPNNDISWHRHGEEENEYASQNLKKNGVLLFGRITYEMMAGYWPTKNAMETDPEVAKGMNNAEKIVFSRTLENPAWKNTRVISNNIVDEIKKMKKQPGNDMTILGSGTIVTQFAEQGLIDEYQIMVDPVAIGNGTSIFKGLTHKLDLKFTKSKTFRSGVVLLYYEPFRS
jgi:dihydrofolate reductase